MFFINIQNKKNFLFYVFFYTFILIFFVFNKNNIYAGIVLTKPKNQIIQYYDENKKIKKNLVNFNDQYEIEDFTEYYENGEKKFLMEYFTKDEICENKVNQKIKKKKYTEYFLDGNKFREKKYDIQTGKIIEESFYNRGRNNFKIQLIKCDRITGRIISYKNYNERGEIIF